MKTDFPDPDNILNFILSIEPDEGMYRGGKFTFDFAINQNFPHEPPKVLCREKIYHPNIDLEGKVCLNILREDWKPVLNLNAVIVGLQFLFLEPNASDPLNKEAADDLRSNREGFKRNGMGLCGLPKIGAHNLESLGGGEREGGRDNDDEQPTYLT
ncbi:hypothetical protein Trihar35433_6930 [Trichoderma harzianum]|nr:hypothetical protein Trihar35433_6930 [Trichoderma harzianum]